MNVAIITKVEYVESTSTNIPFSYSGTVTSANIFGEFKNLDIVHMSATLVSEEKPNGLVAHTLQFKIAGMDAILNLLMLELNRRRLVYRVTNIDGTVYILGNRQQGCKTIATLNSREMTTLRGYTVTATHNSLFFPLIYQ